MPARKTATSRTRKAATPKARKAATPVPRVPGAAALFRKYGSLRRGDAILHNRRDVRDKMGRSQSAITPSCDLLIGADERQAEGSTWP